MEVTIIDKNSGKPVGQYIIHLNGQNYTPEDSEYFSQAWKSAVEDCVVEKDKRENYNFILNNE